MVFLQTASAPAQLVITPAQRPAANAATDETEALKQQLKETQDRLQAFEAENEALRRRNDSSNETIHTLTESLAVANAEGEVFRGSTATETAHGGLGPRVGRRQQGSSRTAASQVGARPGARPGRKGQARRADGGSLRNGAALHEDVQQRDPQIRLDIEAQLRAANEAVDDTAAKDSGGNAAAAADLTNGQVVSIKEEYLADRRQPRQPAGREGRDALPGAARQPSRGRARVVDVRERISGAVIEEYGSNTEKVKVGDRMHVDVQS